MDLIELSERLAQETAAAGVVAMSSTLSAPETFPALVGVETTAYDLDGVEIGEGIVDLTAVLDAGGAVIEAFAVRRLPAAGGLVMEDSRGISVGLAGAIDAEQFLYFCALKFPAAELSKIVVYRQAKHATPLYIRDMDPLFLHVAMRTYGLQDEGVADHLALAVIKACDPRVGNGFAVGCKQSGWCLRSYSSARCSKTWGLCYGIEP